VAERGRSPKGSQGLSADEHAAVKQAVAETRRTKAGKNTEQDVLDAIAAMDGSDRAIAEGLHALVKRVAPDLTPRTWYGFPAYAREGKVLFFWQFAAKFKTRYGHLGFQDGATLDEGSMWPTAFAITTWDAAIEQEVETLIRRAVGD
jgi:uncharacterized protein YdhG (YjbR/CyaY superfamily)